MDYLELCCLIFKVVGDFPVTFFIDFQFESIMVREHVKNDLILFGLKFVL